jgi:hypothetical protein
LYQRDSDKNPSDSELTQEIEALVRELTSKRIIKLARQ